MAWTTYRNNTGAGRTPTFCIAPGHGTPGHKHANRTVSIPPGCRLTYDATQANANLIQTACQTAGLTYEGSG